MQESLPAFQRRIDGGLDTLEYNSRVNSSSVAPPLRNTWTANVYMLGYSEAANVIPLWRDIGLSVKFQSTGYPILLTVNGNITQAYATMGLGFEVTDSNGFVCVPRSSTQLAKQNMNIGSGTRLAGGYSVVLALPKGTYIATGLVYAAQSNSITSIAPCSVYAAGLTVRTAQ
jgi:hypothetical protein